MDETGDGLCSCDCCGGNVWIWNEDLSEIEEFMVFSYLCAVILYQKYAKISFIDKSQHPPGGCGESDWNILLQGEKYRDVKEKGDFYGKLKANYQKLNKEKEEWLKSLHLDENRIIDRIH